MSLSLSSSISLYSIPVVWFLGFYPTLLKSSMLRKINAFNNVTPRANVARLAEKKVDPKIAARAARMEGAHLNGNETFPLWAVAVLAANYAKLDNHTINTVAVSYIGLRILFNWVYINHTAQAVGHIRSVIWTAGIGLPLYLLVKSANAVHGV